MFFKINGQQLKIVCVIIATMKKKVISIILIAICLMGVLFFAYTGNYYRCSNPDEALRDTDTVSVKKTDYGYFFDGPSEDKCLIFYPGGLVEDIAYADLLKDIADRGFDCALVHMPYNLAVFNPSAADRVKKEYSYSKWYIGGHSLGGAMSADYCAGNASEYDGLIMLAAYPSRSLRDTEIKTLTIYGTKDRVLNKKKLNASEIFLPADHITRIIGGGNHDHFGSYGRQKGDGKADITRKSQQIQTAELIADTFK